MRKFAFVLVTLISMTACGGMNRPGDNGNPDRAGDGSDRPTDNTSSDDTVEIAVIFTDEFDSLDLGAESRDNDGDTVDSASASENDEDMISTDLGVEDADWVKVYVNIDGGWDEGGDELAFNQGADRDCGIHADFDRLEVDGDEVDVEALPHHCDDDPSDCDDKQPTQNEGCDLWAELD